MKTALIAGASGLVGSRLMYCLLKDSSYSKVIVLLRKELAIKDPKLVQVIVNYDELYKYKEQLIADDVFCCLGTTIGKAGSQKEFSKVDFTYPLALATLAAENKSAQFFIITSLGADKNSSIFYSRTKGEVEAGIAALGIKKVFFIRPSLLLGTRKEFRLGEEIARGLSPLLSFFLLGTLKKYKPIHDIEVARAMQVLASDYQEGAHIIESHVLKELGADKSGVKKSIYEKTR